MEREDQLAHEMGVTGVPAMIFGNKVAVSGAREPEVLAMVIDKVAEMQRSSAAGSEDDPKTCAMQDISSAWAVAEPVPATRP